jgi:hypothetical protein
MQRFGRLLLIGLIVGIVLVGLGYAWGAAGRRTAEATLADVRQQLDLAEARAHLLEARVSLYNMNFGDASRRLEQAQPPLRRIRQRFVDDGRDEAVRSITAALEHVEEGQRLSGKLDPAANSKAGDALEAIRLVTSQ